MPYKVRWDVRACKELKKLDNKDAITVLDAVARLTGNPSADCKPLEGKFKNKYRLRVGDYRVIYWAKEDENTIFIIAVRHRKEAYE
ncbi:MAG: type II toxin-antitoxin system RelE/ParE family toxin [Actinomycetota bacterium]|nr:type II toxin-antitoxin system RelE/ParE family toxin [Nitrospiraceae bacterium]MDA8157151.1 type II toxin-antitoxin system RelE/ParE family toxin [Actinomycetota bacterium]